MRKSLLTALSFAPAAFASAQTMTGALMTGAPMSAVAYNPHYTESA